eukprot:CAMPEP_0174878888 /NCGR_PEP_ID=MMETSP1114-20130205/82979_1 /TAXON_ID=312471 /ORGANISM="Neobodo designis, Strain CCAP 1951/1" /LENGTH=793 /DNA_ID=CAMNT_0016114277 /DNA_START=258 /DNA_END=2635 /DNA_ORIENTATION=+
MPRIPLAAVFAVQVVVSLLGVAVIVGVLVSIHHDAAIASATSLTQEAAKYVRQSVISPFEAAVPQVKATTREIDLHDAWCNKVYTENGGDALKAHMIDVNFRKFMPLILENPGFMTVVQVFRMPTPDPGREGSHNNSDFSWTSCGCQNDDPDLCFFGRYFTPAEGYPLNTTTALDLYPTPTVPYNSSRMRPLLSAPFPTRALGSTIEIMQMTAADREGRWATPNLLPVEFLNTVLPNVNFVIPTEFDPVTGYATNSFYARVSLVWLAAFLANNMSIPATRTAVVDVDSRFVLAHNFDDAAPLRYPNASNRVVAFYWTMEDVPSPDMQLAFSTTGLSATTDGAGLPELVVIEGDKHMFGMARIRLGALNFAAVITTDKAHHLAESVKSRNISIAVGVSVFVLLALAVAATTVAVVSPIRAVAEQVRVAADFQAGEAKQMAPSALSEVAELQEAYQDLNAELNRVRGFVPQAVLLRYDHDPDLNEEVSHSKDESESVRSSVVRSRSVRSGRSSRLGRNDAKGGSRPGSHTGNQSSNHRSSNGAMVPAAALLHLGLKAQSATVVVANLSGFVRRANTVARDVFIEKLSHVVDLVVGRIRALDGVLALFHGDHFVATFNAARPCASHARRGCTLATQLAADVPATSLKAQSATVVVANLSGFVRRANTVARDVFIEKLSHVVDLVVGRIRALDGVLALFHGDHFVATFNAARPCASHARRGCTLATQLAADVPATSLGLAVRCGIATGRCLVGNIGAEAAKASAAIGGAYTRASLLERMCRLYDVPVLATQHTVHDV